MAADLIFLFLLLGSFFIAEGFILRGRGSSSGHCRFNSYSDGPAPDPSISSSSLSLSGSLPPPSRRPRLALDACRRNNKEEKAERNRIYARRFLKKDGTSGRSATREAKRAALDAKISRFAQGLYQVTTDADDPDFKADKNVLFGI